MSAPDSKSEIVAELADQFLERYRRGERPSLKEYIERHPELAVEIRDVFPALAMMENIALADESMAGSSDTGENGAARASTAPLQQLGDYRIIRVVGQGGMGVVYEAEQVSLGRHVALKVLPQKLLLDARQKRRFEREAKSAAKLHHTNIVPVFGVGEQDKMPYYVMQFIQGLGLDEVLVELKRMRVPGAPTPCIPAEGELRIARREVSAAQMARSLMIGDFAENQPELEGMADGKRPGHLTEGELLLSPTVAQHSDAGDSVGRETTTGRLSDTSSFSASSVVLPGQSDRAKTSTKKKQTYWQSVANIGVQVADALDYAHNQGVLHRDIKPSNLLLDTRGTVWVTDFGLAKTDDQQNLTHTGDILGTLRYMSPEAFEGRSDPRSDVYSLGLTIYELLALRPAYEEKDRHRLIKKVMSEEPPRLDRLNATTPRDLETIVHKAIDKDPGRRYQSAGELSADLQRFIDDEPIKARRLTLRERSWRWCRHNPLVAGLAAALMFLLLSSTIGSLIAAGYYDQLAKKEAQAALDERAAKLEATANLEEADRQKTRAQANFAKARAAVDDYLTKVSESQLIKVPGLQPLRRELLESALGFYQQFLKEQGNDPGLRIELATAYVRIARIQAELGNRDEAKKNFDVAFNGYAAALRSTPHASEIQFALATALDSFALMNFYTDKKEARTAFVKAIDLLEDLLAKDPSSADYLRELARSYSGLSVIQGEFGEEAAAFQSGQRCVELRQGLILNRPDSPVLQHAMGESLGNLGYLLSNRGHTAEAVAMYERSLGYMRAAHEAMPQVIEYGVDLHIQLHNLADAEQSLLQPEKALVFAQQDVDHTTRFAERNPAVPEVHVEVLDALLYLCRLQAQTQDAVGAEKTGQRICGLVNALPNQTAEDHLTRANLRVRYKFVIGPCFVKLTPNEQKNVLHEGEVALDELRKAVALGITDANRIRNTHVNGLGNAVVCTPEIAKQYKELLVGLEKKPSADGQWLDPDAGPPEAMSPAEAKSQPLPSRGQIQADLALTHYAIALAQIEQEQLTQAERSLDQAQPIFENLDRDETTHLDYRSFLGSTYVARGLLHWRAGRFGEAKKHWEKGFACLENAREKDPNDLLAKSRLADSLTKIGTMWALAGCWSEAADHWHRAFELNPQDHLQRIELGALYALEDDPTRYRAHCQKLQAQIANVSTPHMVEQTAKMCLVLPADGEALKAATSLSDRALQLPGHDEVWQVYCDLLKGMAEYRKGNFEAAAQLLNDIPSHFPRWKDDVWSLHLPRKAVLAMSHFRSGHKEQARSFLINALQQQRNLQTTYSILPRDGRRLYDGLLSRALVREAYQLIEGKPLNESLTHSLRAHIYAGIGDQEKAEKELQAAAKLEQNDPSWLIGRGAGLAQIGLTAQAEADFTQALAISPNFTPAFLERGRLLIFERKWKEAVPDVATFVDKVNEGDWAFRLAPLLVQAGDWEGYHRYCQKLVSRFQETYEPVMAERTAKACLFVPPDAAYREAALSLADRASSIDRGDWLTPHLRFVKGLAEYRRGNFRVAAQWCRRVLETRENVFSFLRIQNDFVLSMALAQLHDSVEAKATFTRAAQLLKSESPRFEQPGPDGNWHDWLICRFLHEEAKRVVTDDKIHEPAKLHE